MAEAVHIFVEEFARKSTNGIAKSSQPLASVIYAAKVEREVAFEVASDLDKLCETVNE